MSTTIACQGTFGANSQAASRAAFGNADIMFMKSFEAVFTAVAEGLCEYGVLPIENSTYGSVSSVYDLLCRYDVRIVKAIRLPIRHCLAGVEGSSVRDIKTVISHEQALGQCREYLKSRRLVSEGCANTAIAARTVSESRDCSLAAICSEECALEYGLKLLARDIQDSGRNYTRFICIGRGAASDGLSGDKTSIVCTLENRPGSLCELLDMMALEGINLTKIESRPIPNTNFEFMFYIDFTGDAAALEISGFYKRLERMTSDFRLLGCYCEFTMPAEEKKDVL